MRVPGLQAAVWFVAGIVFALLGNVLWGMRRGAIGLHHLPIADRFPTPDRLGCGSDAVSKEISAILNCKQCASCDDALLPASCMASRTEIRRKTLLAYDATAARDWLASLHCPLHRSMWVVSTLTPAHPREGVIMERLIHLTSHSSWGVLLISLMDRGAPLGAPVVSTLGPSIAIMNVSAALLAALPLEIGAVLIRQLYNRAQTEWGRSAGGVDDNEMLLTAHGRLHVAMKLLPYLLAIKCGAAAIFDTIDDDIGLFTEPLSTVNAWMVEVRATACICMHTRADSADWMKIATCLEKCVMNRTASFLLQGLFEPDVRNYTVLPSAVGRPTLEQLPTWPVLLTPRADIAPVVNPYASLGNRHIVPRGFPAELVYNASFQALHLQRQVNPVRPLIQQWVSHAYPDISYTDMAALRTHELPKVLKSTPNVVMGRGAWAPFNTRGTLFLPDAYWALFLSPAQPAYMSDVLRSYWATRILWDAGGSVSFRSVASPKPPVDTCGSHFGFHNDRLSGDCEGAFLFRDIVDRNSRLRLLEEELQFQAGIPATLELLENWQYTPAPSLSPEGPDLFRRARSLMCNLAESGHFASCRDVTALRAWLRDLSAAGYSPPSVTAVPPPLTRDVFNLRTPDPSLLSFNNTRFQHNFGNIVDATRAENAPYSYYPRNLAVVITGLAQRVATKLEPEDYQLAAYKRPPRSTDELLLSYNLRMLGVPFGGPQMVHHYYVLGTYASDESTLHAFIEGKLPFVAVVVHRDWVIEPLLPANEQAHMPRHNSSFVTLKWTNEAQHYQRSQLHQVWEVAKCFELVASWQRRFGVEYVSYMRHRSDYEITLLPGVPWYSILQTWVTAPNWTDSVYVPEGEDWRVSVSCACCMLQYICSRWSGIVVKGRVGSEPFLFLFIFNCVRTYVCKCSILLETCANLY